MVMNVSDVDVGSSAVLDQLQTTVRDIFTDHGISAPDDVRMAVRGAILTMWVLQERAEALELHGAATRSTVRAVQHLNESVSTVLASLVDAS
jgi:hypothetical protein